MNWQGEVGKAGIVACADNLEMLQLIPSIKYRVCQNGLSDSVCLPCDSCLDWFNLECTERTCEAKAEDVVLQSVLCCVERNNV